MLLTVDSTRQLLVKASATPDRLTCNGPPAACIAGRSAAARRWRLRVLAQEELPLTLPSSRSSFDDDDDAVGLLVTNDDQIERLLAHIHKRLPHSKPARALLRGPPHIHPEELLHDAAPPRPPLPPHSHQQPHHHQPLPHPEFHTVDSQLQLSLDGAGIDLLLLDSHSSADLHPPSHVPPHLEDADAPPPVARSNQQVLLTSFPDTVEVVWGAPGEHLGPATGAGGGPPLVVSGGPLPEDTAARQREWLQQLLDRSLAAEPPAAAALPQQAQQQRRTTGARTKQCGCGAVLHNRVAACPECGHQFYSAAAKPRAPGPKPRRRRSPTAPQPPAPAALGPAATAVPIIEPQQPHALTPSGEAILTHPQPGPPMPHPAAAAAATTPGRLPTPPGATAHPKLHADSAAAVSTGAASAEGSRGPPQAAAGNSPEEVAAALGVTAGAARRLMAANPNLGTLPPAKVAGRVQQLAATLSVTRELALAVTLRQPSLLSLTPGTLRQHFDGLCVHLHLQPRELRRVVARCPDLLLMAPTSAARKLQRIAAMLRVSPLQVLQLAMAAPKVVSLSVDNLREKLLFCRNSLGLSQPARLYKVLQAHPSLLTRSVAAMRARLSGTAALLGLSDDDARRAFQLMPALLYKHCDSVEAKVAQLAELLGVPMEQATRLAAQNLCLLGMDASGWDARVDALAAALGLPRQSVVKMLARMPALLGLKAAPLGERLRKMASRLRLPRERVRQMVEAQPSLLTIKYAVLGRRWQALCALAALEPSWRCQLLGYEVSTMAVLLSRADDTFLRLQYLAASGAARSVALATAVQLRPLQFRMRYPDFLPWVNDVLLRGSLQRGRRIGKGGALRALLRASAAGALPLPPAAAQQ